MRGADIAGGFFAPNMLLARLQRQAVGRIAVHIDTDADQTPRQAALEGIAASHIGRVRATCTHGHTKALGSPNNYIRTHFTWRFQQRQRQQVGGQNQGCAFAVDFFGASRPVGQPTAGGGVLLQGCKIIIGGNGGAPFIGRVDDFHH